MNHNQRIILMVALLVSFPLISLIPQPFNFAAMVIPIVIGTGLYIYEVILAGTRRTKTLEEAYYEIENMQVEVGEKYQSLDDEVKETHKQTYRDTQKTLERAKSRIASMSTGD